MDVLVLVNAVIAVFLLRCTARMASVQTSGIRLAVAGLLAGISSLMLLLPSMPAYFVILLKLGSALFIIATAFRCKNIRRFFKAVFWYFALNLALSGIVLISMYYGNVQGIQSNNLSVYFNVTPFALIGSSVIVYFAVRLCELAFGKHDDHPHKTFICTISMNGQTTHLHGVMLIDSGFRMKEPISGENVFLMSFPAVKQALPPGLCIALQNYFENGELCAPLRLMVTQTAVGMKCLPAMRSDLLEIEGKVWKGKLAVFSPERLAGGTYDAIISQTDVI